MHMTFVVHRKKGKGENFREGGKASLIGHGGWGAERQTTGFIMSLANVSTHPPPS